MLQLVEKDRCVAIVLNRRFIIGYKAMINSVLTHTPKFNEPIVCVNLDLTEEDKKKVIDIYPNISFVEPKRENYSKLPPHSKALKNAFFKVEMLRIAQKFDKVLFLDSDMIFLDSISPLLTLTLTTDITLCPIRGQHKQYNTGLMLFKKLSPNKYNDTIQMMKHMKNAHLADQAVIISAINQKILSCTPLDTKWNTTKREAKAGRKGFIGLHFVGKKPFNGGEPGYEHWEKIWRKYSL